MTNRDLSQSNKKRKAQKPSFGRINTLLLVAAVGIAAGVMFSVALAGKKTKIDTPEITCGTSTQGSIDIQVCAPIAGTGAPAGFTVQWMTCDDYVANGNSWVCSLIDTDGDGIGDTSTCPSYCAASFSGNAFNSRYNLAASQCVTVRIGDLLFDNGSSADASCAVALKCGTCYVFRAFSHANSSLNRSEFTGTLQCSTLPCDITGPGCTYTQGYWKTHGPVGCATGNNADAWPDLTGQCACTGGDGLCLGTICYSKDNLCTILNTQGTRGNGLPGLAHQLIAAKLSILNGADGTAAALDIAAADALIGATNVLTGSIPASDTSGIALSLDNYNNGLTGPGHCTDE